MRLSVRLGIVRWLRTGKLQLKKLCANFIRTRVDLHNVEHLAARRSSDGFQGAPLTLSLTAALDGASNSPLDERLDRHIDRGRDIVTFLTLDATDDERCFFHWDTLESGYHEGKRVSTSGFQPLLNDGGYAGRHASAFSLQVKFE